MINCEFLLFNINFVPIKAKTFETKNKNTTSKSGSIEELKYCKI